MKFRYILILIIFISCKTEVDNKLTNRNINIKSKNLYINGTADESSFIKYFNLSDESNFYNKKVNKCPIYK